MQLSFWLDIMGQLCSRELMGSLEKILMKYTKGKAMKGMRIIWVWGIEHMLSL